MGALFVTGASGFIGRELLRHIPPGRYERVLALSRRVQPALPGVTWVQGDITDASRWRQLLTAETDVAHLAAATGAAPADRHRAVNLAAVEELVRVAERARVKGLLYVSTIAARYPEDPHYPYASAKRGAEAVVRSGVTPWVIVRPTIVLGQGSPILDRLRNLAGGPRVIVIGPGLARTQPIAVRDVAAAMALLLERRAFDGGTRELGGPEVLTMERLLQRVRAGMGKPAGRLLHVPYRPLRWLLVAGAAVLGRRAMVTPGQLTPFVQDSVAEPDAFWEALRPHLVPVDDMVRAEAA